MLNTYNKFKRWCYLVYKGNTPYLVIGKIYGDLTLLKDFILTWLSIY